MGAVIGLSDEQVHEVVEKAREHGEISVANANAPGQIVLSGVIPALVFALEMSRTVGARKAVRLTVSVASHSPLMRRARDEFGRILAKVPFRDPQVPMLGNVHASVIQHRRRPAQRAHRAPRPRRAMDGDRAPHGGRWRDRLRRDRARPRAVRPIRRISPEAEHPRARRARGRLIWPPCARCRRDRSDARSSPAWASSRRSGSAPRRPGRPSSPGARGSPTSPCSTLSHYDSHVAGEVKGFDATAVHGRARTRAATTATRISRWPRPARPCATRACSATTAGSHGDVDAGSLRHGLRHRASAASA